MKEFVTAGGRTFECKDVATGTGSIVLAMESRDMDELETFFRDAAEPAVSLDESGEPHGKYDHLKFSSITKHENGDISIQMRILTEQEIEIAALQESQAEQDELLAELKYGN